MGRLLKAFYVKKNFWSNRRIATIMESWFNSSPSNGQRCHFTDLGTCIKAKKWELIWDLLLTKLQAYFEFYRILYQCPFFSSMSQSKSSAYRCHVLVSKQREVFFFFWCSMTLTLLKGYRVLVSYFIENPSLDFAWCFPVSASEFWV